VPWNDSRRLLWLLTRRCVCVCVCVFVRVRVRVHSSVCGGISKSPHIVGVSVSVAMSVSVSVSVCTRLRARVCVHTQCACMRVCMRVCLCLHVHIYCVCVCVCLIVCVYSHTNILRCFAVVDSLLAVGNPLNGSVLLYSRQFVGPPGRGLQVKWELVQVLTSVTGGGGGRAGGMFGAALAMSGTNSEKSGFLVILYRNDSRALTFENFHSVVFGDWISLPLAVRRYYHQSSCRRQVIPVYVYIYTYIYMDMYMCIYVYVYIYMDMYICMCMYECICICIISLSLHERTRARLRAHAHTHTQMELWYSTRILLVSFLVCRRSVF
jgi:hypothetical protein